MDRREFLKSLSCAVVLGPTAIMKIPNTTINTPTVSFKSKTIDPKVWNKAVFDYGLENMRLSNFIMEESSIIKVA